MVTSLGSLPLEPSLGLVPVETSLVRGEMKHEMVLPVTIHILNVATVRRAGTAAVSDDIGGSEPIPDVFTRRIELVSLKHSNWNDPTAIRIDRILLASRLDIDREVGREVRGDLATERRNTNGSRCQSGTHPKKSPPSYC